MNKKIFFIFLMIFIVILPSIYSIPLIPTGNILMKGKYGIDNATFINSSNIYSYNNVTATDYICVAGTCYNAFSGSGTMTQVDTDNIYLTGGPITTSGTISLNETKLNETIISIAGSGNTTQEMINAVNGTALNGTKFFNINWSNIVNKLITWTDVTNKPFNGVDETQGLKITSTILGIDHTYLSSLYNQTSELNVLDARELADNTSTNTRIDNLKLGNTTLEIRAAVEGGTYNFTTINVTTNLFTAITRYTYGGCVYQNSTGHIITEGTCSI